LRNIVAIISLLLFSSSILAQFSPGKLSNAHKDLEGLNNCTKCHEVGASISEARCLDCHKALNKRIKANKGFHVSKKVKGKSCISCHSEHHGRKFDALHFDEDNFEHELTGYKLEGAHAKVDCQDCHKPDFISDKKLKKNKKTFLGLATECLSCHEDYHQGTLPESCLDCHTMKTFKKVPRFDHNDTKFPLKGSHNDVSCIDCHKMTKRNGKKFQLFNGLKFSKCTDCHEDPHENKFGQNCTECHNEKSWHILNIGKEFDHDKTGYPLEGKHEEVDCKECHTNGYKENLSYTFCTDCHDDYHEGDFVDSSGSVTDCIECHDFFHSFTWSKYGLDEHQDSEYPLTGSHEAVSCLDCHKPDNQEKWNFTIEDQRCISCHDNIHEGYLDEGFLPNNDCEKCHNTISWKQIEFDHDQTDYTLDHAHLDVDCRECHFTKEKDAKGNYIQEFTKNETSCVSCHEDIHQGQFEKLGENKCDRCHSTEKDWKVPNFDHQQSAFPLEGKHAEISCTECHKPIRKYLPQQVMLYRINPFECRDCHGT